MEHSHSAEMRHDFGDASRQENPDGRVADRASELGIELLWHAPGLLRADPALAPDVLAAAGASPDCPGAVRVVYHFDETQPVAETFRLVGELHLRQVALGPVS